VRQIKSNGLYNHFQENKKKRKYERNIKSNGLYNLIYFQENKKYIRFQSI
jgi:hypothetical protein